MCRSIEEMARSAGWRVRLVPQLSVEDGVNAVRTLFPTMWFDRERCADGLQDLRRYRFDVGERSQFSRKRLHDSASHFADALRYVCVAMSEKTRATHKVPPKPPPRTFKGRANLGWMRW